MTVRSPTTLSSSDAEARLRETGRNSRSAKPLLDAAVEIEDGLTPLGTHVFTAMGPSEDGRGLRVKGRILTEIEKGRDAAALVAAGAIDGLSIGYRTVTAEKDAKGQRLLREVELWEVSLVTFPMLPEARVSAKGETLGAETLRDLAALFEEARRTLAGR